MDKGQEIVKGILTVILWILVIVAIAFAVYVYVSPEPVQITDKNYNRIDTAYYNVDENELGGEWLEMQNYTVEKEDLDRYEDLKELYKGRDNPFSSMNENREQIIVEQKPVIPDPEDETIIE